MNFQSFTSYPSAGSGDVDYHQRKRKRPVISCNECHRRKQKCNRSQPCSNCTKRDKTHLCIYACEEEESYQDGPGGFQGPDSISPWLVDDQSVPGPPSQQSISSSGHQQSVSGSLGYSNDNATGTLGLIRMTGTSEHAAPRLHDIQPRDPGLAFRYRNLIQQLPPPKHVDALKSFFFSDVAWYYDVVDQDLFAQQIDTWSRVPYSMLTQDPLGLPPDVCAFPALLFQVLAQALLFQPAGGTEALSELKYAPGMTLVDLAVEFSDAGDAIAATLGTEDTTMSKVQAGLLRASFQKSMGTVVGAWHTLGSTIRDAQEIGLHRLGSPGNNTTTTTATAPTDAASTPEQVREVEIRARLWLMLHLWDGHMAVVLGRPMATKVDSDTITTLLDSIESSKKARWHGQLGGAENPSPTPFSLVLLGYRAAYRYLPDIHELESTGSAVRDKQPTIDRIQSAITSNMASLPYWAMADTYNPGAGRGHIEPPAPWLPAACETLVTEVYFTLLALHRPYVFTVPESRQQARNAAIRVLESQSRLFNMTEPRDYMPFNFIFATFDALVLIATIHILFPAENRSHLEVSLQSIEWGLTRLNAMRNSNKMATVASEVAHALYAKMAVSNPATTDGDGSMSDGDVGLPRLGLLPEDLASLPPPQPLHDLVLQTLPGGFGEWTGEQGSYTTAEQGQTQQSLQDDEFWRLMDSLSG